MGLHSMYGSMDIVMHILTDCLVFKHIDNRWLEFKTNPKTRCRTRQYESILNVIIKMVNLAYHQNGQHLMLSLFIEGKRKVKDSNVYIAPLINELQDLWSSIDVIDNLNQKDNEP